MKTKVEISENSQAPSAKLEKQEQKSRSEFENLDFIIKEKNSCWDSIVTWHNL
jgi:hypothetical protein